MKVLDSILVVVLVKMALSTKRRLPSAVGYNYTLQYGALHQSCSSSNEHHHVCLHDSRLALSNNATAVSSCFLCLCLSLSVSHPLTLCLPVCLLFVCQSVCVSVRLSETRKRRFTGERFREARLGVCVSSPRCPYIIIHISYFPLHPPPPASSQPCLLSSLPPPPDFSSLSLTRDGAPRMQKIDEAPFGKSPELSKVPTLKPVLNWAYVCSPEHTSDTSTNYDSFLN